MVAIKFVLLIFGSYFIGNVFFAKILSKKVLKDDISKHGSGNPGMTNMLRTYGLKFAIFTLILDMLKGVLPAVAGLLLFKFTDPELVKIAMYTAGLSSVLGNIFPVCYGFKGGKGAATMAGICLVVHPLITLGLIAIYALTFYLSKMGSLACIIAGLAYIITETVLLSLAKEFIALGLLWAVFLLVMFGLRNNIKKIFKKSESKIYMKDVLEKDAETSKMLKKRRKEKFDNSRTYDDKNSETVIIQDKPTSKDDLSTNDKSEPNRDGKNVLSGDASEEIIIEDAINNLNDDETNK